jgi:hypothetical protein
MNHVIDKSIDKLRIRVQNSLEPLICPTLSLCDGISHFIGNSKNEIFPLRTYLEFSLGEDGVSIIVDVKNENGAYLIESDICCDHGKLLAEGPSITLTKIDSEEFLENDINQWHRKFEVFLSENYKVLKSELLKIKQSNITNHK